jgi:hypothetical protein
VVTLSAPEPDRVLSIRIPSHERWRVQLFVVASTARPQAAHDSAGDADGLGLLVRIGISDDGQRIVRDDGQPP